MDPNETLKEIRQLVTAIAVTELVSVHVEEAQELANDLAEKVSALDNWVSHGGFLPDDWRDRSG